MTDEVIVAMLGTFGLIFTALLSFIGVVVTVTRKHAKAARYEVQNNHDTNLRDDLDEKFQSFTALLKTQGADLGGMKSDIRAIHRENAAARDAAARERDRLTRHIDKALTEAVAVIPRSTDDHL